VLIGRAKTMVNNVLSNKCQYPICVVRSAERFKHISDRSSASCTEIRGNYRDVWNAFKKCPSSRLGKFKFSISLNDRFGKDRMSVFHTLINNIKEHRVFIKYEARVLKCEIALARLPKEELRSCLKFVEEVNSGATESCETDGWYSMITPERFSEIVLWRLINSDN